LRAFVIDEWIDRDRDHDHVRRVVGSDDPARLEEGVKIVARLRWQRAQQRGGG
jgi:hypothetical protein